MIRDNFFYDGKSCMDYGIIWTGARTEDAPERDLEFVSVPGRSGDLIRDNGRYSNVTVRYSCAIVRKYRARYDALRAHLFAAPTYRRLEDTMHPNVFRLAAFQGPIEPDSTPHGWAGTFDVQFNCKPHRYLKSGEFPMQLESGQVMLNSWDESLPLIQITGSGSGVLTVGGVTVTIDSMDGSLTLDAETQNAYSGLENKNGTIRIAGGEFPTLPAGETRIAWSGGVTTVEITPRWRAI